MSLVNQTMSTLDAGQVRRVLTEALGVWSSNSKLNFREIYSEDADIQVLFAKRYHGDGYNFDGPGQVLAHAFYPGEDRGGDAHFDEEENWLLNGTHTNEGTNLMGVAVHEFGHSLGLGHSSVEDALMFPWYHGYQIKGELPEDDRLAIAELYGGRVKSWGPYQPQRPRPTSTTTTTTTTRRPLRYYPEKPPRDRDNPRQYPGRNPNEYPQKPHDRNYPRYPENDPRYPQNDPRYPQNDPRYPQNDPRYPQYNPRYPENDPRYHPDDPRRRQSDPRYSPSDPRYPHNPPRRPSYEPNDKPQNNPRPPPPNPPRHPQEIPTDDTPRKRFPEPTTRRPETTTRRPYHTRPTTPTTTTHHPHHRVHQRHKVTNRPKKNNKPDTCSISYDAISIIRGELFIFKDQYLWRIGDRGLYAGYPHEIKRLWKQLPEDFTHIDAVYENQERKIVFFIGSKYYVFDSNVLLPGYPQPITRLGLPGRIRKIDAAFVWGYNNKTYFFSNTLYWRFDEEVGKVELDYPRDMLPIWQGIGYNIDTAFQYLNGKTYFFKGKEYWEFNDRDMRVAHIKPKLSAHKWMGCPRITTNEVDDPQRRKEPLVSDGQFTSSSHRTAILRSFHLDILLTVILLLLPII